jgi:hypothetical protein
VLVLLAVGMVGCASPRRVAGPVIERDTGLRRLGASITAFDAARGQVLRATGEVVAAALAVDEADAACAAGATTAASRARARVSADLPKAKSSLSALPARLTGYQRALSALAAAEKSATSLDADQRSAVDAVVAGGRAESNASDAFRVAGVSALPAYVALDAAQATWLTRRTSGWYRDPQEAAAAYDVLVRDQRPALDRARQLLQRVDAARRPVSDRERSAVAAANTALTSLLTPG